MKYALLLILLVASAGWASITPNVPSGSRAGEFVDKLEALGCAYPTFRSLGPQSYADVRAALDWNPDTTGCEAPEWLLDERQLLIQPSYLPQLDVSVNAIPADAVLLRNLPATVWPLFPQRENRALYSGVTMNTEVHLSGRGGGETLGYAMSATPGWAMGFDTALRARLYLQEAYFKVGFGFSEMTVGRYGLRFGETKHGSLLFSGASAPLDLVEYALRPVVLGGAFSGLGPFSVRTFLTGYGADVSMPYSKLWGVEIGLRPFHWWEIAFAEVFQFGGVGSPSLALGEVAQMALAGGGTSLSGRRNASLILNMAFWAPARFTKLYGQILWSRAGDVSGSTPSYLGGVWFPKLTGWDARFEYVHTAVTAYQHPIWTQGMTYRGGPLGHVLGPDGEGAYLDIGLPPIAKWWRSEVGLLYEARQIHPGAGLATETRYGVSLAVNRRWKLADVGLVMAYHQVHGAQYTPGVIADNFGAGMTLRYAFLN